MANKVSIFLRVLRQLLFQESLPSADAPYMDHSRPLENRIEDLLGRMSLREKTEQMHGLGQMRTPDHPSLGIPSFKPCDGPRGVGEAVWRYLFRHTDKATAFPSAIAIAATWDPAAARSQGAAITREALAKGRNWLLAPCLDIPRDPRAGRTQETFGEDPHLTSALGVAFIQGVHEEGGIACAKHFIAKHQETFCRTVDSILDERTLREMYYPPFRAAVQEAGVGTIMTGYNRVNGVPCPESQETVRRVLKEEWGFDGLVVSDWKDLEDTHRSIEGGTDLEMPKEVWYGERLAELVEKGEIEESKVDDSVRRILRTKFRGGVFDRPSRKEKGVVNQDSHRELAFDLARRSLVLLKNEGPLLPLDMESGDTWALLGPVANAVHLGDGGSSEVRPISKSAVLPALRKMTAGKVQILHERGCGVTKAEPQRLQRAVAAASKADVALCFVGFDERFEGENIDRLGDHLELPGSQIELIEAVLEVQPRTVVIVNAGSAVTMDSWIHRTPTVLKAFYGGERFGPAVAEVLLGLHNPSGRLPLTFPRSLDQLPAYPSFPQKENPVYSEGIFVGYRHFDHRRLSPLFPFGHGLSYTTFSFDRLQCRLAGSGWQTTLQVTVTITNSGDRKGIEVIQLYVSDEESRVSRPPKELKAFQSVQLAPGESRSVPFGLTGKDFAFFDGELGTWVLEAGEFSILVGRSSADIQLRESLTLGSESKG